jgi:hypothetical protein
MLLQSPQEMKSDDPLILARAVNGGLPPDAGGSGASHHR